MTMFTSRRLPAWRLALWGVATSLLLAPAVAMRFTQEVQWDGLDFLVFGGLLLIACGAFELSMRLMIRPRARGLAGFAIVAVFLLVWAELAVGLFH